MSDGPQSSSLEPAWCAAPDSFTDKPLQSTSQSCPLSAGEPPATPPTTECSNAWADANQQTQQVLDGSDGGKDVVARNRRISAAYAQSYFDSGKQLKWAGVAAFASKQVGCGMQDAKNVALVGSKAKSMLADGNQAVFKEINPLLKMQTEYAPKMGPEKFAACLKNYRDTNGNSVPPVLQQAMTAQANGDRDQAALLMLQHEQQETLQKAVYDHPFNAAMLNANRLLDSTALGRMLGTKPVDISFTAACEAADPNSKVSFDGHLPNYAERWPFAKSVVSKFDQLPTSQTDQELQGIINAGGQ